MKIGIVKNNLNNIFAAFSNDTLVFPDDAYKKQFNSTLSNPIQNWAQKTPSEVFLTTYLTKGDKRHGQDLENILLYDLNSHTGINSILGSVNKIIIQGMDNVKNWPQPNYLHYYFYGFFDNFGHTKYTLYDCSCKTNLLLDISDYQKLLKANRNDNNNEQILTQISQNPKYNFPKNIVPLNSKFCLKININSNFFPKTVDNLKKLVDRIVVFCNKIDVIATNKPLVNANGYNPTDDLLYYCEIERVDNKETKNDIIFYVCPICTIKNKPNCFCEENQDSAKNSPGFRKGDEIEFFSE
jgi:hypothetical protein